MNTPQAKTNKYCFGLSSRPAEEIPVAWVCQVGQRQKIFRQFLSEYWR